MIDVMTQIEIMADMADIELDVYNQTFNYKHECVLRASDASLLICQHSGAVNDFYTVKLTSKSVTKNSTIRNIDKLLTHIDMFCRKFGNGD